METAISTALGVRTRIWETSEKDAEMSIAEYIILLRDTLYPSGKIELKTKTGGEIADGLGEILINMNSVVTRKEIRQAIKNYRQAIMINPDDTEAHFKLGISFLVLKDRRSALEEYKVLKGLSPRMADELLQRWNIKIPWSYR